MTQEQSGSSGEEAGLSHHFGWATEPKRAEERAKTCTPLLQEAGLSGSPPNLVSKTIQNEEENKDYL